MKKILALILVFAILLALVACSGNGNNNNPPANNSPGNAPGSAPGNTPGSAPGNTPDSSPGKAPGGGTIGYYTDDIDPWARREYNLIYYNFGVSNVAFQVQAALEKLGKIYNFKIEQLSANADADAYVTNLQTILMKGVDGLIIDITQELASRVSEILNEYNTPAICMFNSPIDVNGVALIPSVVLNQYYNGQTQMNYLNDHYKDYWGDIDRSKIVLLRMDWSNNMDLVQRAKGSLDRFKELFPGNRDFYGDTAASNPSPEAGFDVATSILSANPDVEYWFITSSIEDVALGTGRAVEALGLTKKALLVSSGAAILPGEWDQGYDGIWIANYSVPPVMYAGIAIFGLFALIEGRATYETLWPEYYRAGDKAPRYTAEASMMSRDNYKEYIANIARTYGLEE